MCALLASEATPNIPFSENKLSLFCITLSVASIVSALIPTIFQWDWRTKYFGLSAIHLASASLLGIIPWLCIVFYSALPLWARLVFFCLYATPIVLWCRRFARVYHHIYLDKMLREHVFIEDADAIYYSQRNDNWMIEKKFKFKQFPSNAIILFSVGGAFLQVPYFRLIKTFFGLPFPHMFLTIISIPITLTVLGLATRAYLVFYYYPWLIKKATGKEVYVDMVTKSDPLRGA